MRHLACLSIFTTTARNFDEKMSALCSSALFNWKMIHFLQYLQPHLLWKALLRNSLSIKLESVKMKENVESSKSLPIMPACVSWCHCSLHHIRWQPCCHCGNGDNVLLHCGDTLLWIMMSAATVKWLLTTIGYYREGSAVGRKDEVVGDTLSVSGVVKPIPGQLSPLRHIVTSPNVPIQRRSNIES